jgi:RNAse (barnase) inhibitor barstar
MSPPNGVETPYFSVSLTPNNPSDFAGHHLDGRLYWEEDAGEIMINLEFVWEPVVRNQGIRRVAEIVRLLDRVTKDLAMYGFKVDPAEGADDAGAEHITEEDYEKPRQRIDWSNVVTDEGDEAPD